MRRSTRAARKRDDDGDGDDAGAGNNKRARASLPPAKAAPVNSNKKSKRTAAVKRASPSDPPSSASDDGDCDADSGNDVPVTGIAPEWVHSLFSREQRAQWDDFLRTKCLARVGDDFYDLFELACAISKEHPLGAFIDSLGIRLCGSFDLLDCTAKAVCDGDKKVAVSFDKPLFLHGRYFLDPPEVTTVLQDASSDAKGAHWGYFRDSPEQTPEYIVFAEDSSKGAFSVAGSSLFHVLDARIKEQSAKSSTDGSLAELATKVDSYLRYRKIPSHVTPVTRRRKRASQATAPSLHQLGIVVPYDAKKQTGFRELPVVGEQLAALLRRVQDGDATARKALSGLITRATIATDECDFGTSLLLGLDLFTAGAALEKESLQLLKVAYMLLRRLDFYKIASAHTTHRSTGSSSSASSSGHQPPIRSIVPATSPAAAQSSADDARGQPSSHVADAVRPKPTTASLPQCFCKP